MRETVFITDIHKSLIKRTHLQLKLLIKHYITHLQLITSVGQKVEIYQYGINNYLQHVLFHCVVGHLIIVCYSNYSMKVKFVYENQNLVWKSYSCMKVNSRIKLNLLPNWPSLLHFIIHMVRDTVRIIIFKKHIPTCCILVTISIYGGAFNQNVWTTFLNT